MSKTIRHLHISVGVIGLTLSMAVGAAAEVGGIASSDLPTRWQLRLDLGATETSRLGMATHPGLVVPVRAALLGDYDLGGFDIALARTSGRFRATSGLMFEWSRPWSATSGLAWPAIDSYAGALPYLGLGYTGWLAKSGLSFSADVGLMADYQDSSWRFGRALFGNQGSEAALRELRLQPRLQLGLQYRY